MFGNLFEEDEDGFSVVIPNKRSDKGKDAEPPPPRGSVNLSGIKNQGGTCYLNSLLQTLLFTPEFREALFSLGPEELGCLEDKDKPEAKVRVIPLELQRLFAQMLLVDQQTASTAQLTDSFGWTSSEESSQHDVQELNRILFSALEHSLVGTSGSNLIHQLYHGTVVNQVVCKECGNVSERQEDFLDLTVSVAGVSGLEEALWNMFVEEEVFEGNNLYRCSRCNVLVRATKSAKLRKLPPFLTVSLLRFSFDFSKCERYKETGRYLFPLTINLKPFCEEAERPDSEYTYDLFSVIIHKGGCYGGHYHVYIKDIDQLGRWEVPEEESRPTTQRKLPTVTEPVMEQEDPLSVLTAIISQEASRSVLVDQLGQKLLDKIGISWNKKFRKEYGPIGKFLQSHSDTFILVSNGQRVALKATTPASAADAAPLSSGSSLESTALGDCPHWFDLNDSTVTPIQEKDIEKQFQGKESAYMLFYRQAELLRPREAKQNPGYRVPTHLLQMVQEENGRLQKRREEFDTSANTIEIHLHLAPQYCLEDGSLQPKDPAQGNPVTLTFDRRRSVGELRLAVYQMQDLWEGDVALTVVRMLPAGPHLYDTLTEDEQSVYGAGVRDGSDLFVWNGREVCGMPLRVGSEWEPVLLTLLRASEENGGGAKGGEAKDGGGSALAREARGFPKGATLGLVREAVGPEQTLLCREESRMGSGGGGGSGWRVYPPSDMQRTLRELALKDGDALLVLEPQALDSSLFSLKGDVVTVTTPSDCRWLQVEFWPRPGRRTMNEEEEEEHEKAKVSASGNMLLAEVKLSAIEALNLQDQLEGVDSCLRQVDHTGRLLPPVREDRSVREAGVKLMTSLLLCPGAAPGPGQLFLYFIVGSALTAEPDMEIVVDETIAAKECLQLMLRSAGLEGEGWHLRKMDWCEEVGDALEDEDASLAELNVVSGDTLVLTEGRLPPKGFLKLPVWLFNDCSNAQGDHAPEGAKEHRGADPPAGGCGAAMRFVGHVEISVEAALDELKIQALTLPALQDVCVPRPAFLRVWLLEGRRPSRILRGDVQPLKNLKLGTRVELCLQPLQKEENLGPKELLLRVQMGVAGERGYYPSEDLVWDMGWDGSARGLCQAVAAQYGLFPDSLIMAKYCPEKYTWTAISTWSQQVSKRKKKKKLETPLMAPFHLKDGDIVGVKNLLIDSNQDFSTLQDELGQLRLQQEAERQRNGGQTSATGLGPERRASRKTRKPEVALSINVGVFR